MSFSSRLRLTVAKISVYLLFSTLFFSVLVVSSKAFAWGHLNYLNDAKWGKVHLVFPALASGKITYCLAIDSTVADRFEEASIDTQIQSVIQMWLRPVKKRGLIGHVQIIRTSCAAEKFDLKIAIGPESKYPTLGSYQIESIENGHKFTLVKIDSNYQWQGVSIIDFKTLVGADQFAEVLSRIQQEDAISLDPFASSGGNDFYYSLFWSTQRILLHEIGHSFGLCDTIPSQVQIHCDPNYLTSQFDSSVMSDSDYLSLTKDDIDGIVSLFKRFSSH